MEIFARTIHVMAKANAVIICCMKSMFSKTMVIETRELSVYYPDIGKLSDLQGYLYEKPEKDLSIIIPMYNVAPYIAQCLDSILNQETSYSFEVLLVDDGSMDATIARVAPYLENPRVTLLKQHNFGQSVARNRAIYQSHGKYLMFVDGDDILLDGAIEILLNTALHTNSEIVEGKHVVFHADVPSIVESEHTTTIYSYQKKEKYFLTCYGYSVAKVYKRELWQTLRYPESYIFEDVITKFILRRNANQVAVVNDIIYGYRYNLNSSSHGNATLKKLDSIWVFPRVFELCEQENAPKDDFFYLLALNHIGMLNYATVNKQPIKIKKACFFEMQKQILSLEKYRSSKIPLMFRLLEKAIITGNINNWEYIASVISRYNMLKKWREIN